MAGKKYIRVQFWQHRIDKLNHKTYIRATYLRLSCLYFVNVNRVAKKVLYV
jgi:hypothetical protein